MPRAPLSGADQPDAAVASRALPALSLVEVNRAPGLRNRVVVEVLGDESVLRGADRSSGPGEVGRATRPNRTRALFLDGSNGMFGFIVIDVESKGGSAGRPSNCTLSIGSGW